MNKRYNFNLKYNNLITSFQIFSSLLFIHLYYYIIYFFIIFDK